MVWEYWRTARDRLFREHPQSPLPAHRRARFPGCDYFEYDPRARLAHVERAECVHCDVVASTGAEFPFSKIGEARFALFGDSLALLWTEGYGGGLFVSFQDETSGQETYPGGALPRRHCEARDLGTNGALLILDFNFAYNPSCAYDSTWACPLAMPENRLSVPVRVGEQSPR